MADFKSPFVHNYTTGRNYWGPSLEDKQPAQPLWLQGEQKPFYQSSKTSSNLWLAGGIAAAGIGAGFVPAGRGRVWDYYVRGIRAVEEYSPAQMLRTFQFSNFFSQFETAMGGGFPISANLLRSNQSYAEYLRTVIGGGPETLKRLYQEGITLKSGRAFWGETEDVALRIAAGIRTPTDAGAYWGSAYARSIGAGDIFQSKSSITSPFTKRADIFFSQITPNVERPSLINPFVGEKGARTPVQVIGANAPRWLRNQSERLQDIGAYGVHAWRQTGAWGTELVSRFNRLLRAPVELEPFSTVFKKIEPAFHKLGMKHGLAISEGPGLKMLGNLGFKFGLGLGALALGYQTIDYAARESETLDQTIFSQGITAGVATAAVETNLLAAKAAEVTGLQGYREWQEEVAPGSTSFTKLAAFPIMGGMAALTASYALKVGRMAALQRQGMPSYVAREQVVKGMKEWSGPIGKIGRRFFNPKHLGRDDKIGRILRKIATKKGDDLSFAFLGKIGPTKFAGLAGLAIGTAAILPFLPGALIPEKSPEELERIYSGEQEVAIRKGRWWEFGRSAYEGKRIMYHRPHWYPRMIMRAKEKGLWGEDEPSPITKWWKKEMTYDLEREHYQDRPYPITSVPFEDIPFIGPLLAATIGKIIKPPQLMHTEEWLQGDQSLAESSRFGQRVATEIGEQVGGIPESPYNLTGTIGEQVYRMTEMIGLPGFAAVSIKEHLTGTSDLFDQTRRLESARRMAGFERSYWDLELGGLLGITETFRRLYPHRRRQIPLYNPIRNLMPEWLPGPGEKAADLWHGDPFVKLKEGELRLPGRGYEARYPELKDVDPEDYPLIHRFRILADVAPYTDKYKVHLSKARAARKLETWTEYEEDIFQTTLEQVKARKIGTEFQEYQYLNPMGGLLDSGTRYGGAESSSLIATLNQRAAEQEESEKRGVVSRMFGGFWELLSHNAETALDQITPISPGAKLVHMRTPIESYEKTQLYGTENAFWQHPWKHFWRPSAYLFGRSMGYEGVPDFLQEQRSLEEHFDILKYVKFNRLSNMARQAEDKQALKEFESKKNETLFGINPFTGNYRSIFRALPRRERDYFNAFSEAETTEERQRILQMVPDNEKGLYVARWKMAFADEVKEAKKAEILTENQEEEADEIISDIYEEARAEGFPKTKELFAEYIETRLDGENYGDWYRRTKVLPEMNTLPGPDWVGWHPSVDLEDIKLKVVQDLGEDLHDYNLWPSRAQALINKQYINDEAVASIVQPEELTRSEMHDRINRLFRTNEVIPDIFIRNTREGNDEIVADLQQDSDIDGALEKIRRGIK